MPLLPAFCDQCGNVFPSGFFAEGAEITFSGCTSGPCPHCGGDGHVPDGVFNLIANTIEILSAPQRTLDELLRFAEILKAAQAGRVSPGEVADRIKRELPTLSAFTNLLPKNRGELYGFLALVLAALQLLTQSSTQTATTNITINQVVETVYVQSPQQTESAPNRSQGPDSIRRNAPCLCGSGKRYKNCCGDLRRQSQP